MFTGIAEGTGKILTMDKTKDGYDIQVLFEIILLISM